MYFILFLFSLFPKFPRCQVILGVLKSVLFLLLFNAEQIPNQLGKVTNLHSSDVTGLDQVRRKSEPDPLTMTRLSEARSAAIDQYRCY